MKKKIIEAARWPIVPPGSVIGIDPSLNGTAISVQTITGDDMLILTYKDGVSEINKLVCLHRFFGVAPPAIYFLEGMSFGSKHYHTSPAMVQGIIRANIASGNNSTIYLVPPSTLKMFTTGNGHGKKEDMKLWVYKLWGREFGTNDEVDAYALMMIGRYYMGHAELPELNQKRKECLAKITKYV